MPDLSKRPDAPVNHQNESAHRRLIAVRANASLPKDGSQPMTEPLPLFQSTQANLPDAGLWTGAIVFVTDAPRGEQAQVSNGVEWTRPIGPARLAARISLRV